MSRGLQSLVLALLGATFATAAAPALAPPRPRAATAAAPAAGARPRSVPARRATMAKPDKGAESWALVLAGKNREAEDAFAARLVKDSADLDAAIGLSALLDARDDAGTAEGVLARALSGGARGPLGAGAVAALVRMSPRAPDGGAAAIPVLTGLVSGTLAADVPAVRAMAVQALAGALARQGEADRALAMLAGPAGLLRTWSLVGPYGRFSRLDLLRPLPPEKGRIDPRPDERGPDGLPPFRIDTTFADGRVVIPPQFRGVGTVYAIADIEVRAPVTVHLSVDSAASLRVLVDGAPAVTLDRVRAHPPAEQGTRVDFSAGRHRILVKLANEGRFPSFNLALQRTGAAAADGVVTNVPAAGNVTGTAKLAPSPSPLDEGGFAPDATTAPAGVIARAWWLQSRDLDEQLGPVLQQAVKTWPKATLFQAMLGDWALGARTGKSADEDLAQARQLLGAAAEADPHLARPRLLIARMDENAGQLNEAWQGGEAVLALRSDDPDALALEYRVALKRGWIVEAGRRIERARAAAPARTDLLDNAIELYRRTGATQSLAAALQEKARRDPLDEGWPAFLGAAGRVDEARAAWERLRSLRPSYLYPYIGLALLEADSGHVDRALAVLDEARTLYPYEAVLAYRRAALLSLQGQDQQVPSELHRTLELDPSRVDIWESLARRGEKDTLAAWLASARDVLAAAPRPAAGTDSALLADIASVYVDAQGGQTELYQGVHAVYTRAGVEREGELEVLPGAHLQGIRIHKKNDSYADVLVGDKRPVSLPGLEPGDSIEYVWRRYIQPYEPVPGSLDNRTLFLFQGQDREYVLSRYVVAHDRNVPVEVCGNTRGLAATDEVQGDLRVRSWTARQMPRLSPEPHVADPLETVPNIRLGLGTTWPDIGELAQSALAGMLQPDAPLPALADEIRRRAGAGADHEALARALHELVRDRLRPGSAPLILGLAASASASAGEGNRTTVALALAQMLGLEPRLVLGRPVEQKGRQLDCPSPQSFSYALVEIPLDGRSVFLDYADADYPFDTFPYRLAGADALQIPFALDQQAKIVELPRRDPGVTEQSDADVTLGTDGLVSGRFTLTTRGATAAMLRRGLRELPADQRPNVFRQLAADAFAGAQVEDASIEGERDPDADLVIRTRIAGGSWARQTPTGFALPVAHKPLGLFNEYAPLPARQFALLLDAQEFRRDTLKVKLPAGLRPVEVPGPVTLGDTFGGYSLLVKTDDDVLTIVRNVAVPPARVEPAEYTAFREFARKIDVAESREITLSVGSPSLMR